MPLLIIIGVLFYIGAWMTYPLGTLLFTLAVAALFGLGFVILAIDPNAAKKRQPNFADKAINQAGRGALWVAFPPAGLWRSWKHGQRKRDERLARMIRGEE